MFHKSEYRILPNKEQKLLASSCFILFPSCWNFGRVCYLLGHCDPWWNRRCFRPRVQAPWQTNISDGVGKDVWRIHAYIYIYTVQDYQSMSCLSSSWVTSIPNHPRSQYLSRLGFRKCKHESVLGRQLWLCKRYVGNFCLEGLALKHVCWSQSI